MEPRNVEHCVRYRRGRDQAIRSWLAPMILLCCCLPAPFADVHARTPSAHRPATQLDRARDFGRAYTRWLYQGDVERLWRWFSAQLQSLFGGLRELDAFQAKLRAQTGDETRIIDEQLIPWLGASIYHRTAVFSKPRGSVWVQWTLDSAGEVLGLQVQPARTPAASRFLDYRTRTRLQLPFSGEWFVFWGGRTTIENYHAVAPDQRFAYDFVIARNGSTHHGDPARNESYFCFGKPARAPAAATVAAAAHRIPDNIPGKMNEQQPLGNHVVLDHGNGEFSFLAHLEQGSVAVKPGQHVRAGAALGRCGNSGRSSEPHLHYHLQTTLDFGRAEGLPAQFLRYRANGEPVARGEPARGQKIAPMQGKRSRS